MLFTKSVLTTELAKALIVTRAAVAETKQRAKDTRKLLRKKKVMQL